MKLSIKTTGLLGQYLPEGSARNRGTVELAERSTVQQLIEQLNIPDNGRCHVTLNGTILQRANWDSTVLNATDEIVLMAPISAG